MRKADFVWVIILVVLLLAIVSLSAIFYAGVALNVVATGDVVFIESEGVYDSGDEELVEDIEESEMKVVGQREAREQHFSET